MIAIQKIGKSFAGALAYNLKKLHHPDPKQRAELLDSNFSGLDDKMIRQEIDLIRGLKPKLNRYVYHTSLNFSNEELSYLDNEKLTEIAKDYLTGNGFTNNQYLIFRHYDAGHPHVHLLVNRVSFDGTVVSDSNNYKRSEEIVRMLERKYNLTPLLPCNERTAHHDNGVAGGQDNRITMATGNRMVLYHDNYEQAHPDNKLAAEHANKLSVKAPTKDELEMILRTGNPSDKMLLQELLKGILKKQVTLQQLIAEGENKGISFLFNKASTGRISGITYFYGNVKVKGQALGNSFKWTGLLKIIDYEQSRDSKAVDQANDRARAKYGNFSRTNEAGATEERSDRQGGEGLHPGGQRRLQSNGIQSAAFKESGERDHSDKAGSLETNQDGYILDNSSVDYEYDSFDYSYGIEISDDIDDEAIHGRNRHRQRQARTNTR